MMRSKLFRSLSIAVFALTGLTARASHINETVSLNGSAITIAPTCTVATGTGRMEYGDPGDPFNMGYPCHSDIKGGFSVGLRFTDQLRTNFGFKAIRVVYSLRLRPDVNNPNSNVFTDSVTIYLSPHTKYVDQAYNHYENVDADPTTPSTFDYAYKAQLCVLSVKASTNYDVTNESGSWTSVSGTLDNDYYLDLNYHVERYFCLNTSTQITLSETNNVATCSTTVSGQWTCNDITVNWNKLDGAEAYELEWLFVDMGNEPFTTNNYPVDWRNATRIRLESTAYTYGSNPPMSYKIPLGFPRGRLFYRIRGTGILVETVGSVKELKPVYGKWSGYVPSSPPEYIVPLCSLITVDRIDLPGLESAMNWTLATTYAEDGKRKDVLQFYDGAFKPRQTTTFINSDNNVVIGEARYDYMGRNAVNIIPAVKTSEGLKFYGVNVNSSWDKTKFDLSGNVYGPDSMSSGVAYDYYSVNNTTELYVPNAKGYPYTRTIYMNDGTNRVLAESGIGRDHKIGSAHETQYLYGRPTIQKELDRLFGNEVGFLDHYQKNAVKDANGQVSVSYLDAAGNVIATALSGSLPSNANVLQVDNESLSPITMTGSMLGNNALSLDGEEMVSTQTIVVTSPGTYTFNYNLTAKDTCNDCLDDVIPSLENGCVGCKYDLTIIVRDVNTGQYLDITVTSGPTVYATPKTFADQASWTNLGFTVNFPSFGSYEITKKLKLNRTDLNATLIALVDELIDQRNEYRDGESETKPQCIPYNNDPEPCDNCETLCDKSYSYKLEDETTGEPIYYNSTSTQVIVYFNESGQLYVTNDDFPGHMASMTENTDTVNAILTRIDACKAKCELEFSVPLMDECSVKWRSLRTDMSPGGQYFDNLPDQFEVGYDPNDWLEVKVASTPTGIISGFSTWTAVRNDWDTSYATILVNYHPEICTYRYFCLAETRDQNGDFDYDFTREFDVLMNTTNDDADAITLGLFDPLNSGNLTGTNGSIHYNELSTDYSGYLNPTSAPNIIQDPYFSQSSGVAEEMAGFLNNYITFDTETTMVTITLSVYDVMEDPAGLNIHSEPLDGTSDYPDAVIQFMQALHGDGTSCGLIENGSPSCTTFQMSKFQFFKSYYMFRKRQIQQTYMSSWMNSTNCSGDAYPNFPLTDCVNSCPPCSSCSATEPCNGCYLTSQDSDGDGFTDDGFFINYPYIDLFNIDMTLGGISTITSSVEEDICLGQASALASQWVTQMEMTMIGCQGVNMPFSMAIRNKLKHYFFEVAKAACNDAGIGNTFTTGHTIPNYTGSGGWGTMSITSSTTFNDAIDDVITLFETNETSFTCINHVMYPSVYVSGTDTITDNMVCACNNFGFYIIGNADTEYPDIESPFEISSGSFVYYTIPLSMTDALSTELGITVDESTLADWAEMCFSNDYSTVGSIPEEFFVKFKCDDEGGTSVPGCNEQNQIVANYTADYQFENNLDALVEDLKKSYKTSCMGQLKTREKFDVTYDLVEYHYTLYYYDQAGNLIKTVPPAGVVPVVNGSGDNRLDFVNAFRVAHHSNPNYLTMTPGFSPSPACSSCTGFVHPVHTKVTNYIYNSLNQPVQQFTPDAGFSKFLYDALGRLVMSQNSDQFSLNTTHHVYSYTLYDYLGRIEEVGELKIPNASLAALLPSGYSAVDAKLTEAPYQNSLAGVPFLLFMNNPNTRQYRTQITKTFYEEQQIYAKEGNVSNGTPLVEQSNLRNRVATTAFYEKVPLTTGTNVDWQYYDNATHYSYDMHGNVKKMAVDIPAMEVFKHRFFTTDYEYDLISGKVNLVAYQKGFSDQFYHKYVYDADNRITEAYTSTDSSIWEKDARYMYYKHGPLKRMELGDKNVQGIDYAYTIHGWLKQVNGSDLNINVDMGKDGRTGSGYVHGSFAIDAFGYSLGYYDGDYKPVGIASSGFYMPVRAIKGPGTSNFYNAILPSTGAKGLYNGNITSTQIAMMDTSGTSLELMGNAYKYDQLNRIKESNAFLTAGVNMTTGTITNYHWDGVTNSTNKYKTAYTYDPDGNIKTLLRNGGGGTVGMDDFTYYYTSGKNYLDSIYDPTTAGNYTTDIDGTHRYTYYDNGNLKTDASENIAGIDWTVYGKVKKVRRTTSANKDMMNFYDPSGQRLITLTVDGNTLSSPTYNDEAKTKTTVYIRDASGNIMSIYEIKYKTTGGNKYELTQVDIPLYGSSRLGLFTRNTVVGTKTCSSCNTDYPKWEQSLIASTSTYSNTGYTISGEGQVKNGFTKKRKRTLGVKNYELNNHLGNVQVTISDRRKTKQATGGVVDYYKPDVRTYYDYYPFGMPIPGRSFVTPECNMITTAETTAVNLFYQDFENAAITYYGPNAHQRMTYDGWYQDGTGYTNHETRSGSDKWMKVESNDDAYGMRKVSPTLSLNTSYRLYFDLNLGNATSVKIDIYDANSSGVPQGSPTTYTISSNGDGQYITYTTGGTYNKIVIVFRQSNDGATRYFYVDDIVLKLTNSPFTESFSNNFTTPTITATALTMTKYQFDAWTPWSHSELYQEDQSGGNTRVKVVTTVSNHGAQKYYDGFIPGQRYTIKLDVDLNSSASEVKVFIWDVNLSGTVSNERTIITASTAGSNTYTGNFVPLYNKILVQVRRSVGSTPVWFYMDNFGISDTIYQTASVSCTSDDSYRFGFNGKEKTNEVYGEGNLYDYGFRIYDPRIGKFLSVDPLTKSYPELTPYQFSSNTPIWATDLDGKEAYFTNDGAFAGWGVDKSKNAPVIVLSYVVVLGVPLSIPHTVMTSANGNSRPITVSEFMDRVHWSYGEGGGAAASEYAHAINNRANRDGEFGMFNGMNAGEKVGAQGNKNRNFGGTKGDIGSPNYDIFYKVLRNGVVGGENEETLENLNLDNMTLKKSNGKEFGVDIGRMRNLVAAHLRVLMGEKDITGGATNWAGGEESEDYVLEHYKPGTDVTKVNNKNKGGYPSTHYFYQLGSKHTKSASSVMKTTNVDESKPK